MPRTLLFLLLLTLASGCSRRHQKSDVPPEVAAEPSDATASVDARLAPKQSHEVAPAKQTKPAPVEPSVVQVGELEWRLTSVRLAPGGMTVGVEVVNQSTTLIQRVPTHRVRVTDEFGNFYGSTGISNSIDLYPGKSNQHDWSVRALVDTATELRIEIRIVASNRPVARFVMPRADIK
jgi:hypothetical protein